MKRLLFWVGLMLAYTGVVFANEPAVLNDPKNALEDSKETVSAIQPSADLIYNTADGDWYPGASIRLYTADGLKDSRLNGLDIRLGLFETKGVYSTLSLDLARITGKDILKYINLGFAGGRNFDDHEWIYGPVFGLKAEF